MTNHFVVYKNPPLKFHSRLLKLRTAQHSTDRWFRRPDCFQEGHSTPFLSIVPYFLLSLCSIWISSSQQKASYEFRSTRRNRKRRADLEGWRGVLFFFIGDPMWNAWEVIGFCQLPWHMLLSLACGFHPLSLTLRFRSNCYDCLWVRSIAKKAN